MVSFERLRSRIDRELSDARLLAIIDANSDLFRVATAKGGKPALARINADKEKQGGLPSVLFIAANPVRTMLRDLAVEATEVFRTTASDFRIATVVPTTHAQLSELLATINPDIVHFSGHGAHDGLYLQGEDGLPLLLQESDLMSAFAHAPKVKLIILNACYARNQAESLIKGADCVVGLEGSVSELAARAFSTALFVNLSHGEALNEAVRRAEVTTAAETGDRIEAVLHLRAAGMQSVQDMRFVPQRP
jgi:CHAT domain-containing protein